MCSFFFFFSTHPIHAFTAAALSTYSRFFNSSHCHFPSYPFFFMLLAFELVVLVRYREIIYLFTKYIVEKTLSVAHSFFFFAPFSPRSSIFCFFSFCDLLVLHLTCASFLLVVYQRNAQGITFLCTLTLPSFIIY